MHSLVSRLGTSPARRRIVAPSQPRWRSRPSPRAGRVLGEEPAPNKIIEGQAPDYYPADYTTKVIDASKDEGGGAHDLLEHRRGELAPIFRDFQKKYPWVKKLSANDPDSDEVFQVLSEQSTGSSPVDMMVSNASTAWATLRGAPGHADGVRVARARRASRLRLSCPTSTPCRPTP